LTKPAFVVLLLPQGRSGLSAGSACALFLLADSVPRAASERALARHRPGDNGVWESDQVPAAYGNCAPVCLCPPAVRVPTGPSPNRHMRVKLRSMPLGGPPWLVPKGPRENSPTPSALGRAVEGKQAPEGRLSPPADSTVPPGRDRSGGSNPMLKHWAIALCPCGTVASQVRKSPKGISLSLTPVRTGRAACNKIPACQDRVPQFGPVRSDARRSAPNPQPSTLDPQPLIPDTRHSTLETQPSTEL